MLSIRHVVLALAAATFIAASAAQATPPGLKLALSQHCLTYGKDWAIAKFLPAVQNLRAPDVHGNSGSPIGSITYDLTSIIMTHIAVSSSNVTLLSDSGVLLSLDLDIKAALNWHYHCWAASDGGTADIALQGTSVSFLLSFNISTDKTVPSYPELSFSNVQAAIADLSFTLHGGASWLYNLFVSSFKSSIKTSLIAALAAAINPDALNKDLQRISEDRQLTSFAALNFDIVKVPTITSSAITFPLLGQILPSSSSPPYPFTPNPLPDVVRGSMFEIIFDQSLLYSASTTLHDAGLFTHVVTPAQFPKLNTSNFCLFSPTLCQHFPNDGIVLTIGTLSPPLVAVSTAGLSVSVNASLDFAANSSAGVLSPFLNLSCSVSLATTLALGNNASGSVIVTADFTLPSPIDVEVVSSTIGKVDTQLLTHALNDVVKTIALPWLNFKGQHQGFPVPVPKGLVLSNSSLDVGDTYVAISSDVHLE